MPTDWCHSAEFREIARRSGQRNARIWWQQLPRCGAHARTTGKPCRRPGFGLSGRCHVHGGLTPSGDGWHRPRWPKAKGKKAEARLSRKLDILDSAERKRAAKLARMTPDELQVRDRWQQSHRPGPPGPRAAERQRRRQRKEARQLLDHLDAAAPPTSPEIQVLAEAADVARRRLEELQHSPEARDRPMTDDDFTDDDFLDEADQRRATIIRRARTEGVQVAYLAALQIAQDPKSPPLARSNACRTLLAVGGLLDRQDRDREAAEARVPSELTASELGSMVNLISQRLRGRRNGNADGANTVGGVFD